MTRGSKNPSENVLGAAREQWECPCTPWMPNRATWPSPTNVQGAAWAGPTSHARLPGDSLRTGAPMVCYKKQRFSLFANRPVPLSLRLPQLNRAPRHEVTWRPHATTCNTHRHDRQCLLATPDITNAPSLLRMPMDPMQRGPAGIVLRSVMSVLYGEYAAIATHVRIPAIMWYMRAGCAPFRAALELRARIEEMDGSKK